MKKIMISCALAALMAVSLVACGSDKGDSSTPASTPDASVSTPVSSLPQDDSSVATPDSSVADDTDSSVADDTDSSLAEDSSDVSGSEAA